MFIIIIKPVKKIITNILQLWTEITEAWKNRIEKVKMKADKQKRDLSPFATKSLALLLVLNVFRNSRPNYTKKSLRNLFISFRLIFFTFLLFNI